MIKQCERCYKYFYPRKNQRFCSYDCRIQTWRENNREKIHQYHHKHTRTKIRLCQYCNQPIPSALRKKGRRLHPDCIPLQQKEILVAFQNMKENLGCQICGYSHCGACIDFHHFESGNEKRINASRWYWKRKDTMLELEKCIPLCKNCHTEVHMFNKEENSQ